MGGDDEDEDGGDGDADVDGEPVPGGECDGDVVDVVGCWVEWDDVCAVLCEDDGECDDVAPK